MKRRERRAPRWPSGRFGPRKPLQLLDLNVAEGDRIVMAGKSEMAGRAILAGMRALRHHGPQD